MQRFGIEILSAKELDVLALWICNQSVKQCAKCLNLSDRSIENYRDRIRCKFHVINSDELLSYLLFTEHYEKLIDVGRGLIFKYKSRDNKMHQNIPYFYPVSA